MFTADHTFEYRNSYSTRAKRRDDSLLKPIENFTYDERITFFAPNANIRNRNLFVLG